MYFGCKFPTSVLDPVMKTHIHNWHKWMVQQKNKDNTEVGIIALGIGWLGLQQKSFELWGASLRAMHIFSMTSLPHSFIFKRLELCYSALKHSYPPSGLNFYTSISFSKVSHCLTTVKGEAGGVSSGVAVNYTRSWPGQKDVWLYQCTCTLAI